LNFSEKIRTIRDELGLTQKEFAKGSGLTQRDVSLLESGRRKALPPAFIHFLNKQGVELNSLFDPSKDVHLNVHPNVHPNVQPNGSEKRDQPQIKPVAVTVDEGGEDNIVMVDQKAAAGYPQHYADPSFYEGLPAFKLPGTEFRQATFRCFQIEGDSMHDTLYNGDWAIARYVDELDNIKEGYIHVLVTHDSLMVKRVLNRIQQRGKLVLQSDNNFYPPVEVDVEDLQELWYVKAKLSFNLPSKNQDLYKTVANLEAKLYEIRKELDELQKNKGKSK